MSGGKIDTFNTFYLYRRYLIANDGHLKNIAEEEKSIPLTPLTSTEDI
jgi:hypothetical protein